MKYNTKPALNNLSDLVLKVCKKIQCQDLKISMEISSNWNRILGNEISENCNFQKITTKEGKLYVKINSSFAFKFMMHKKSIIDRINSYLGYNAISSIVPIHTMISKKEKIVKNINNNSFTPHELIKSIKSERLCKALINLQYFVEKK